MLTYYGFVTLLFLGITALYFGMLIGHLVNHIKENTGYILATFCFMLIITTLAFIGGIATHSLTY
ncbi:hypothetical protein [Lactobacillus ultunensis]|uniref:Uncharacterized protein n=1 Tax=Lactobacillus ultunensis DSM 16047 TaxID=525365 RepID=C2ELF0_9LACO|nr:hypothetical protein [Lactobacillus ultunensis]EEJ72598.1 hypothetical protein HMPREF0548_0496 [Lactobacillus ultunensis DSM 16047]KRL81259.1 hypothetical protein FC57_GL000790 [Lactobacillus ultunensis DSM 16047]QQP28203.1 hypothetical protein H4B44_08875 [Lactobacillus ultunensis]